MNFKTPKTTLAKKFIETHLSPFKLGDILHIDTQHPAVDGVVIRGPGVEGAVVSEDHEADPPRRRGYGVRQLHYRLAFL